jgi:hypothetical protein
MHQNPTNFGISNLFEAYHRAEAQFYGAMRPRNLPDLAAFANSADSGDSGDIHGWNLGVNPHVRDAFIELISTCSSFCITTNRESVVCHLQLPELRLRSLFYSALSAVRDFTRAADLQNV